MRLTPESRIRVSVLFNEPKLLKLSQHTLVVTAREGFSALQRAEIAEMRDVGVTTSAPVGFSALQRAEIAEINPNTLATFPFSVSFSALQRAEIAEISY